MTTKKMSVSVYHASKHGNYCSGDSYFYHETEDRFICALADGLGSGEYAKESSQLVMDILKEASHLHVEELMKRSNEALCGMRGVVLGILVIDFRANLYTFASIGNIGMMTISKNKQKQRNIPNLGYLPNPRLTIRVVNHPLKEGTTFILFSDGVKDKELALPLFKNQDVDVITKCYAHTTDTAHSDDTTLIAIRYEG